MVRKSEIKPYIARCTKCGAKTVLNLFTVNKTKTSWKPCLKCSQKNNTYNVHNTLVQKTPQTKAIHKIIGKVTGTNKKRLKIRWYK